MYQQQMIGVQNQKHFQRLHARSRRRYAGGLLGNPHAQKQAYFEQMLASGTQPFQSRSKIEILKKNHFSPATKADRIARSLAALNQPTSIILTAQVWRSIVEDPDLEDQF